MTYACSRSVRLLSSTRGHSRHFFHHANGNPLTKAWFVAEIREVLATLGYRQSHYMGPSFRIGVATATAAAVSRIRQFKPLVAGAVQPFSLTPTSHGSILHRGHSACQCDPPRQSKETDREPHLAVTQYPKERGILERHVATGARTLLQWHFSELLHCRSLFRNLLHILFS